MATGGRTAWAHVSGGLLGLTIGAGLFAGYVAYLDSRATVVKPPDAAHRQVVVWGGTDLNTALAWGLAVPALLTLIGAVGGGRVRWALFRHPLTALALAVVAAVTVGCTLMWMFQLACHWTSRLVFD
jgi:hypothetical protein